METTYLAEVEQYKYCNKPYFMHVLCVGVEVHMLLFFSINLAFLFFYFYLFICFLYLQLRGGQRCKNVGTVKMLLQLKKKIKNDKYIDK